MQRAVKETKRMIYHKIACHCLRPRPKSRQKTCHLRRGNNLYEIAVVSFIVSSFFRHHTKVWLGYQVPWQAAVPLYNDCVNDDNDDDNEPNWDCFGVWWSVVVDRASISWARVTYFVFLFWFLFCDSFCPFSPFFVENVCAIITYTPCVSKCVCMWMK